MSITINLKGKRDKMTLPKIPLSVNIFFTIFLGRSLDLENLLILILLIKILPLKIKILIVR